MRAYYSRETIIPGKKKQEHADIAKIEKPEATESLVGTLVEVGYDLGQRVRIGTGYNFSHFSDNELGDLVRDSHGFFVRVTGHY